MIIISILPSIFILSGVVLGGNWFMRCISYSVSQRMDL